MELFEYIKSQLPQMPNVQIMKDMSASDELVEYVKESPENTNLGMMETLGCGNEPTPSGEVWYTGILGECTEDENASATLVGTDKANLDDLITNTDDYLVSVNGTNVTFYSRIVEGSDAIINYSDTGTTENMSVGFDITRLNGQEVVMAGFKCPTDVTNVEVTVTHK